MKVILTLDVKGLGKKGSVIEVSPGMAQNSLLPSGKAIPATADNLKKRAAQSTDTAEHAARARQKAASYIETLPATITFKLKTTPAGALFQAVESKKVISELETLTRSVFSPDVKCTCDSIKNVGEYNCLISYKKDESVHKTIVIKIEAA
jgi:large subunit ribosomal protein L9